MDVTVDKHVCSGKDVIVDVDVAMDWWLVENRCRLEGLPWLHTNSATDCCLSVVPGWAVSVCD